MMSKEAIRRPRPLSQAMDGYSLDLTAGQGLSASAGPYIGGQIAAAEKAGGVLRLPQRWCGHWRRIIWTISSQPWRGCETGFRFNRVASEWRETRLVASKLCWK